MPDVRHVLRKRLVDIDARSEGKDQDDEDGATPQGGAAIHVSRLAKSPRPDGRLAPKPDAWVLVHAVDADLEMQMRSGGPTGRSLESDRRAASDNLAAGQPGSVAGRVPVVGRVPVAMDHHEQVPVADAARVEVYDPGVRCNDIGSIGSGDVETGVDLVRPRAVVVRYFQIEGGAAEPLTDAVWPAGRFRPREDARPASGFRRRGLVLESELCDLGVDGGALGLH